MFYELRVASKTDVKKKTNAKADSIELKAVSHKDLHGVNRAGEHLFPFRTEQLSPAPPMVLGSNPGE